MEKSKVCLALDLQNRLDYLDGDEKHPTETLAGAIEPKPIM